MLKVTNIEPADWWELGKYKLLPLAKIFNVIALCEIDEELIHKHLGKFKIHQIEKANNINFRLSIPIYLKKLLSK